MLNRFIPVVSNFNPYFDKERYVHLGHLSIFAGSTTTAMNNVVYISKILVFVFTSTLTIAICELL